MRSGVDSQIDPGGVFLRETPQNLNFESLDKNYFSAIGNAKMRVML